MQLGDLPLDVATGIGETSTKDRKAAIRNIRRSNLGLADVVSYITTNGVSFKDHFGQLQGTAGARVGSRTRTTHRHHHHGFGVSGGGGSGGDMSEEAALEFAQLLFNRLKMPGVQIITEHDIRDFLPAQAARKAFKKMSSGSGLSHIGNNQLEDYVVAMYAERRHLTQVRRHNQPCDDAGGGATGSPGSRSGAVPPPPTHDSHLPHLVRCVGSVRVLCIVGSASVGRQTVDFTQVGSPDGGLAGSSHTVLFASPSVVAQEHPARRR